MKKRHSALPCILAAAMTLSMLPAALAAGNGIAYTSTQNVEVDGSAVQFQMYALRDASGDTNYVKLRDVAYVLNSTPAKFSVGYDSANKSISVTTGQSYTDSGTEMTTPYSGNQVYKKGSNPVLVNGKTANLDAIVLTDDAGGDYTYFKLRDLGAALGFKVDWTAARGVIVETGAANTAVTAAAASTEERLAARVVELVNEERAKAGLRPLSTLPTLTAAAQIRASETAQVFEHTRPDGTACFTALDEANVRSYRAAGENIAMGSSTAEGVMRQWMNSSGHKGNILGKNYTHIGVACYRSGNSYYWVQVFIG